MKRWLLGALEIRQSGATMILYGELFLTFAVAFVIWRPLYLNAHELFVWFDGQSSQSLHYFGKDVARVIFHLVAFFMVNFKESNTKVMG